MLWGWLQNIMTKELWAALPDIPDLYSLYVLSKLSLECSRQCNSVLLPAPYEPSSTQVSGKASPQIKTWKIPQISLAVKTLSCILHCQTLWRVKIKQKIIQYNIHFIEIKIPRLVIFLQILYFYITYIIAILQNIFIKLNILYDKISFLQGIYFNNLISSHMVKLFSTSSRATFI